jgi:hypothetical protein
LVDRELVAQSEDLDLQCHSGADDGDDGAHQSNENSLHSETVSMPASALKRHLIGREPHRNYAEISR